MNAGFADAPGGGDQQTRNGWRDSAQESLHLPVRSKSPEGRPGRNRHQKRWQENTDGGEQGAESSGYAITNEGRHDQNRARRDLSQRGRVGKLLMRQPVV